MTPRTPHTLLEEFHRLQDVIERALEIQYEVWPDARADRDRMAGRDRMLSWVETGTATLHDLVAATRDALSGYCQLAQREGDAAAGRFRDRYEALTGRSFFEDAGRVDLAARAILRRGHIASAAEYRLLNAVMTDPAQELLSEHQRHRAATILGVWDYGDLE